MSWEGLFAATVDVSCIYHLRKPGRSSGALGIRVKPLFSRGMGVNFPIF